MDLWVYILIGVIVVILIYVLATYNSFVKLKNRVKEAFSTMDVYLKKRWDLIPNIVEVVKGYAKHEKDTLKEIVEIRNSAYDKMDDSTKVDTNNKVTQALSRIMALAEAYPDLKANENFLDLQRQLAKMESQLQAARRVYNSEVNTYNNAVMTFPNSLFAKLYGYDEESYFEIVDVEKENVEINING